MNAAMLVSVVSIALAAERTLTPRMHHLRQGAVREWADFPETAEAPSLQLNFRAARNTAEQCLRLRQRDVKESWRVALNGKQIGRLVQDENPMNVRFAAPAGTLVDGDNRLTIEQTGRPIVDDVMVGDVALDDRTVDATLNEATIELEVVDAATMSATPCRLTVIDAAGSLASVGAASGTGTAVRPGVIYTATGSVKFGLPAGEYTIMAGRGFEYSIESVKLSVLPGDLVRKKAAIRREVTIDGYIACDPHVHTLTGSGHGDCTLDERMATIAGEGIDLAIATEHNKQDDWRSAAAKHGVQKRFTTVVGNEVTTSLGHFNVFPLPAGGTIPDHRAKGWPKLFESIQKVAGPDAVVILNHARDRHNDFSPFGAERHVSVAGEDLEGWALKANAMEVVNSGAQRNDPMDLVRDWIGMMNAGVFLTPIGSSDSHDVSRYIVGQGRTYVRYDGPRGEGINVGKAAAALRESRVLSGCGLLATIVVDRKHGPGDLATQGSNEIEAAVKVLGPSWVKADRVELYANGVKIHEAKIDGRRTTGELWSGNWKLPRFKHDTWLAAVATGPGVKELHWPIARPYQPTSPVVVPRLIAVTGAVWIDADGDGRRTCAEEYARRLTESVGNDTGKLMTALADYDESVAVQAAAVLRRRGRSPFDPKLRNAAAAAGRHVERGFKAYADAWRQSEIVKGSKTSPAGR
jgi:hypothetical protein